MLDHRTKTALKRERLNWEERLALSQLVFHNKQPLVSVCIHLQHLQQPERRQSGGPMSLSLWNTDLRPTHDTSYHNLVHPSCLSLSFVNHLHGYKSARKLYHSKRCSGSAEFNSDFSFLTDDFQCFLKVSLSEVSEDQSLETKCFLIWKS